MGMYHCRVCNCVCTGGQVTEALRWGCCEECFTSRVKPHVDALNALVGFVELSEVQTSKADLDDQAPAKGDPGP